ncbi:MAG: hypothetical protein ND895_01840 [Pyrinomonadaceae bacterium]|nr:hypothetical protein [Pyrinomonadaceae bacterium]
MRQLLTLVLVLFLYAGVTNSYQAQSPSAQQIVDRMISAYASCNRYVDEGEVRTIFIRTTGRRTVINPFSTAFVRPSGFRFEFRNRYHDDEKWNRYIIWRDAESVNTWWSIKPGVKSFKNLHHALAGAAGVSSLVSTTVPTLLMPEMVIGNRIKSFSELKFIGEEEVNGSNAYRIEGTEFPKTTLTLWLDKESLMIVKMFQTRKFDTFETETTTTYKPQVDVDVAQEKLAFNPPGNEK